MKPIPETAVTIGMPASELPDAIRVPLDELEADARYLAARLANGTMALSVGAEAIQKRTRAIREALLALRVPAVAPTEPQGVYAECRECGECGHAGINDAHPTDAACNSCDWRGPSPKEDHCPGCGEDGTMTAACPKCGCGRYTLVADATLGVGIPGVGIPGGGKIHG